jgi:hypothetical protein
VDPEIPDGFFKSPYDCLGLIGARVDVSVPVVDRNPQPAEKTDQQLTPPCVIVIRGKGKFIIRSLSEQTKKGRIRLLADKYL